MDQRERRDRKELLDHRAALAGRLAQRVHKGLLASYLIHCRFQKQVVLSLPPRASDCGCGGSTNFSSDLFAVPVTKKLLVIESDLDRDSDFP